MRNKTVVFTVCNSKFLPFALTLFRSLDRFDCDFVVGCTDLKSSHIATKTGDIQILGCEEFLTSSQLEKLRFRNIVEFSTSIKPFVLDFLLQEGYSDAFYFDPDIFVYKYNFMIDLIASSASIAITPHSLIAESDFDSELARIEYGIFNLGFLYVKNDQFGRSMARWWASRCLEGCFDDISSGVFTDQKFFDVVPCLFGGVVILRDPHLNLAYWNFDIHFDHLDVKKISFIHWSSKHLTRPDLLSKKGIDGGKPVILEGRLLELSKHYNTVYGESVADTSSIHGVIRDSYNYSNPFYSRLASLQLIPFDLELSNSGFGNTVTRRNVEKTLLFKLLKFTIAIGYKFFGVRGLYQLNRIARYLGKSQNIIQLVFPENTR